MVFLKILLLKYYNFFLTLGSMSWVQRQIMGGINPRRLLHQVFGASAPSQMEDITLWRVSIIHMYPKSLLDLYLNL